MKVKVSVIKLVSTPLGEGEVDKVQRRVRL